MGTNSVRKIGTAFSRPCDWIWLQPTLEKQSRSSRSDAADTGFESGGSDIFADIGCSLAEATKLTVKFLVIQDIGGTIRNRKPTRETAAELCQTDRQTQTGQLIMAP